jgi:fermentation-respiration switch protein FrsA (DUF1100 family)
MRRTLAEIILAVLLLGCAMAVAPQDEAAPATQGAAPPAQAGAFLDGRWEGSLDLGEGPEPMALRLFPADPEAGQAAGGLLDLPARKLFGYPMGSVDRRAEGMSFSLLGQAPMSGVFELEAAPSPTEEGESFALSGAASLVPDDGEASSAGSFSLVYAGTATREESYGHDYLVDTGRGLLPGSLLVPEGREGEAPLALIISAAAQDRDGDNYAVPGRSDALSQLAAALSGRGIASLRYDRRGAGEAYRLGEREEDLRFDDHVADARSAIAEAAADRRFSGIWVIGYGEGALVGAAALDPSLQGALSAEVLGRVRGVAALCASGKTELETVDGALASIPEEDQAEARAIMSALEAGQSYPDPSPYFADFFRPSIQPYLASYFRYDIRAVFAALGLPILVAAGGSDLQVPASEAELLARAKSEAAYRVVAGMSHALKAVGEDEEANYTSFTDPSIPLAPGLVDLLEAFVKGASLPGVDPRLAGEVQR